MAKQVGNLLPEECLYESQPSFCMSSCAGSSLFKELPYNSNFLAISKSNYYEF